MANTTSLLGDVRRDKRAEWLVERIATTGSLVMRKVSGGRDGEVAAHRFLSSQEVDPQKLLEPHTARTAEACRNRRVVAIQDTSEINFERHRQPAAGLGPTGNNDIRGFFVHPVVAVDADDEALLGIAGARIWTRGEEPTPMHNTIPYDEKESRRWLEGSEIAAAELAPVAAEVIMVADREGDIYSMFARQPETVGFIVRASHDRVLYETDAVEDDTDTNETDAAQAAQAAKARTLFSAPSAWPVLGTGEVNIKPRRPGVKKRTATVTVKAGTVTLKRPRNSPDKHDIDMLQVGLVEVREEAASAGDNEPLLWRLVTTLPVETLEDAKEVVRLYRLRWRIEEMFRVLKRDGLDIEDSQLETASRLLNLAALGLVAAGRIIQLVDARNGSTRPATDVIAAADIEAAAVLSDDLEGSTERQKNPHAKGSLAWLAWIVARFGGWNCYYKPPGPKTMAHGLDRLMDRIEGVKLAARLRNV